MVVGGPLGGYASFQMSWVPCWGVEGSPVAPVSGSLFYKIADDAAFLGKVPKAGLLVSTSPTAVVIVASTDLIIQVFH